jgi:hypothetical protein
MALQLVICLCTRGCSSRRTTILCRSAMRKVKGDGNCFYRAYMFAIYESVLSKPDEAKVLLERFKGFYTNMIAPDGLGYHADAIEMFYEDAIKYCP